MSPEDFDKIKPGDFLWTYAATEARRRVGSGDFSTTRHVMVESVNRRTGFVTLRNVPLIEHPIDDATEVAHVNRSECHKVGGAKDALYPPRDEEASVDDEDIDPAKKDPPDVDRLLMAIKASARGTTIGIDVAGYGEFIGIGTPRAIVALAKLYKAGTIEITGVVAPNLVCIKNPNTGR